MVHRKEVEPADCQRTVDSAALGSSEIVAHTVVMADVAADRTGIDGMVGGSVELSVVVGSIEVQTDAGSSAVADWSLDGSRYLDHANRVAH